MLKKMLSIGLLSSVSMGSLADELKICVFDLSGVNGDTMMMMKDYVLVAKKWDVNIQLKTYTTLAPAMRDFESKQCDGLVADNFSTKKFNNFMATIGAVGIMPNYNVAQSVFQALASPRLANRFQYKSYEVIGYIPYGFAYFFTKDRSINSLQELAGKRLGIMDADPSQRRMAQKVGMAPIAMNIDNIATKFRRGEFDIVPSPLIGYQAFDGRTILGEKGGVANYPVAFVSMNVVLHKGNYPVDLGMKSRQWFSQQSWRMIKVVQGWEKHIPKHMFYNIPHIDVVSYERLTSQLRKEFIDNKTYDSSMITLIRKIRCNQDPKFIECASQ